MRRTEMALCAVALAFSGVVDSQTAKTIREEYANAVSAARTPVALGDDLFGEVVNLKDGVTSFSATDVAAASNSRLPLAIRRTLSVTARDLDNYADVAADGDLMGNWRLDVPVITGVYDERTGWVVDGATPQARCSQSGPPPSVPSAFTNWNIRYTPEQYWHGNTARIPGVGEYPLLALSPDQSRPSDGATYVGATKGDWRVSCVQQLKNASGEGFRVVLPDGTRYTFDWMSSRRFAALRDRHCKNAYRNEYNVTNWSYTTFTFLRGSGSVPPSNWNNGPYIVNPPYPGGPIPGGSSGSSGIPDPYSGFWLPHRLDGGGSADGGSSLVSFCREEVVVNRREYTLHATKVEDRFGNWIAYDYDPAQPRRLRSITSSDGASVQLAYGAHGKVQTVSHNGRTWQYQYVDTSGALLAAVVQPDGRRWSYQYANLHTLLHDKNQQIGWADCEPFIGGQATGSVVMGHPSGATGTFNFKAMMHGTDRTPGGCYQPDPDQPLHAEVTPTSMVYKTASLTSKQISGPGVPARTWSFQYFPSWSWNPTAYVDDCTTASCNSTVRTEVTAPDGAVTRSTFGNDYWRSAGQLQKVETLSNGVVVDSATHTYAASAQGQAFPDRAGVDHNPRNNRFVTEKIRPTTSTIIRRDGDMFASQVETCGSGLCFDAFARPLKIRKLNSMGAMALEVIEYHDAMGLWVLGQVRRRYVPDVDVHGTRLGAVVVTAETEYNAMALPHRVYAFGKLQETLTYTPQGNVATATDGRGNTLVASDYYRGKPRTVRLPATPESPSGASLSAELDGNGWITAATDAVGGRTCYAYDAMGRVTRVTYPSDTNTGQCDASRWHPVDATFEPLLHTERGLAVGHWRLEVTEGNKRTRSYFDALFRPVLEEAEDATNAAATQTQIAKRYDVAGRLAFQSYPQRGVADVAELQIGMRTAYDALGRVVRVESHSERGTLVQSTEYLSGLRVRTTNPRGFATITSHMSWDSPSYSLPIGSIQPEGKTLEIRRHPAFGWPLTITQRSADDRQRATRRYVYDGSGQVCKTIEPETGVTVIGYDAASNPAWSAAGLPVAQYESTTDCQHLAAIESGRVTIRTYDAHNRLARLTFPDGRGDQEWRYTADGLPERVVTQNAPGASGTVINTYQYNGRRMLQGESLSAVAPDRSYTWPVGYGYDRHGHLAALTYPSGLTLEFAPNALGQPTQVGAFATGATYHPNGALRSFTYGNGRVRTVEQNERQLPMRLTDAGGQVHYTYNYDDNGNVTNIWDLARGDNFSRWMHYDELDRLTAAGSASFGGDAWHRFGYDALDNIRSWTLSGVKDYAAYVYDANNRLTHIRNTAGANVVGLGYDEQGNLRNKDVQTYDFDFGNRLRSAINQESYRYDAHGRRTFAVHPAQGASLSLYANSGKLLYQEDNRKALAREHIYLGDQLVALRERPYAGTTLALKYQHADMLGSPVAVTDAAGNVVERTEWEPYGAAIGKPAYDGVGFTGHQQDAATGLTYMQQRYYDPQIGRFLSVDPVTAISNPGGMFNRYKYAANNPYRFVDPDGRQEAPKPRGSSPPDYGPNTDAPRFSATDPAGWMIQTARSRIDDSRAGRAFLARFDRSLRNVKPARPLNNSVDQMATLVGGTKTAENTIGKLLSEVPIPGNPLEVLQLAEDAAAFGYAGMTGVLEAGLEVTGLQGHMSRFREVRNQFGAEIAEDFGIELNPPSKLQFPETRLGENPDIQDVPAEIIEAARQSGSGP